MEEKNIQPPKLADKFLEWYCDPLLLEDLQGDFHERFTGRLRYYSASKAKRLYWWDVIRFFRPYTINKNKGGLHPSAFFLFSNYLKISTRSLIKDKTHSAVSIIGLSLGMTAFILISLYVNDELKYDRFLPNAERIYRITTSYVSASSSEHTAWGEQSVGIIAKEKYPEIESYTSLVNEEVTVENETKTFRESKFYYSDKNYFTVFPYPFTSGSAAAFDHNTIVLTEKAASKYFGENDPLGKSLAVDQKEFLIIGVLKDLPWHTDLSFDAMMSVENLSDISGWTFNFLLFKEDSDPSRFQPKLDKIFEETLQVEFDDYDTKGQYHMEQLPDVHFGSPKLFDTPKSSRANIYLFSSVALLILLIAGINHLNLTLANAARKQAEVGIRKSIGAQNGELTIQFLTKSFLICSISMLVGLAITLYCIPLLNGVMNMKITWQDIFSLKMSSYLVGSLLLLTLLSGSYPAFYLSRLNPVSILQGTAKVKDKRSIMRPLVVFQFATSLGLIICSFIISQQLSLIQNKSHGMSSESVMIIDVPNDKSVLPAINNLKYELMQFPFVQATSTVGFNSWPTSDMDIDTYEVQMNKEWQVKPFNNIEVDENYFKTLELTFLEGRPFNRQETNGGYSVVIVNQALVDNLGWTNPLEETITYEGGVDSKVIGVIDNFHFNSFKDEFEPMLIFPDKRYPSKMMVQLSNEAWLDNVAQIELKWKSQIKDQPFEFQFLEDHIQAQYDKEHTMKTVFNFFVVIAICIACLGLFGLISLTTTNRLKELGIRKVLGAKSPQLWFLLSKEYLLLIVIAAVIAFPLTIYCLSSWLDTFVYKTPLSSMVFIKAIALLTVTALITMSFHILLAISINPTRVLNHE